MSYLSDKIRDFRKKESLTQEELAEKVGVSLMTVRRWEDNNSSRTPKLNDIPKLAEALKTTISYLMEGVEENAVQSAEIKKRKDFPNMAYWGGVIDNAKNIAINGDEEEKLDVSQMLRKALSYFFTGTEKDQVVPVMANIGGHHNENNLNLGMGVV